MMLDSFLNSKYGGYNYVYAEGQESVSIGAHADLSASVGGSVFVVCNNEKGRSIGLENNGMGVKDLALKVLDAFKTDGL